jgi:hypothetical protein
MQPRDTSFKFWAGGRVVLVAAGILAAALVLLVLTVHGTSSPGLPFASTSAEPDGHIAGQVMRGAGLDPRSGAASGALVPVSGDPVTAQNEQGRIVAQAVSARDGSFTMNVPPGAYTVVEGICATKQQVDVRSQAVTQVTLQIPNSC